MSEEAYAIGLILVVAALFALAVSKMTLSVSEDVRRCEERGGVWLHRELACVQGVK